MKTCSKLFITFLFLVGFTAAFAGYSVDKAFNVKITHGETDVCTVTFTPNKTLEATTDSKDCTVTSSDDGYTVSLPVEKTEGSDEDEKE